jgi:hypothetical protein
MSRHTPGPWICVRTIDKRRDLYVRHLSGPAVCRVLPAGKPPEQVNADVALIMYAPELLELAKSIMYVVDCSPECETENNGGHQCATCDFMDRVNALIAKAEGK